MTSRQVSDRWYYLADRQQRGPVPLARLRQMLGQGLLKPADMVLQEGAQQWRPLGELARGDTRTARPGCWGTLALGSGLAVVVLGLLAWGLLPLLQGPNAPAPVDNPAPVAGVPRDPVPDRGAEQPAAAPGDTAGSLPVFSAPEGEAAPARKLRPTMVPQLGHSQGVTAVSLSADGTMLVTGSSDNTARLWDVGTGKEVRVFRGHSYGVHFVSLSDDGRWLATGSPARLWDVATGKPVLTFPPGHRTLALSGDGRWLATGTDMQVRLWEVATGKEIRTFRGHWDLVHSASLSRDGKFLATAGYDKTTRLWDAATGKEVRIDWVQVTAVALSADGKWMVTPSGNAARLCEAATGKEVQVFRGHTGAVTAVSLSGDGEWLATASYDNTVRLWEVATGKEVWALPSQDLNSVSLSRDGKRLATGNGGSLPGQPLSQEALTPRLWELSTGQEIHPFQWGRSAPVTSASFCRGGKWVVLGSGDSSLRLWEMATGKEAPGFRAPSGRVTAVAASADDKWLVTGGEDSTARLWEATTGREVRVFGGHAGPVTSVSLSNDGKFLATGSGDVARVWETASGKELHALHAAVLMRPLFPQTEFRATPAGVVVTKSDDYRSMGVRSVSLSGDGKWLLTASADTARLWEVPSGKQVCDFKEWVETGVFTRDGKWLVTGSSDKNAHLREVASCEKARDFSGHDGIITSLCLSGDDRWLVTGSDDGTARLWEMATGKEVRAYRGHADGVTSVDLSRDGKFLVTGSKDHTARLWEVASGKELCQLISCHGGGCVAATPDNYYLASRGALEAVAFGVGKRAFPFEQFDLKFNRPDKVLESVGVASEEMLAACRRAYQKRLKRMNFTEEMLSDEFHLPEIAVNPGATLTTRDRTLRLKVRAKDSRYPLDRLRVDVNGTPLRGSGGTDLRNPASRTWEGEIDIELSAGRNKVEVSVLNEKGAESLRESLSLNYEGPAGNPNLYVVAVGVSDYQDPRFRLTYADKDARDLAELFASNPARFGQVKVLRLLNREATREMILKTRDFLRASGVDDLVVLFFAGHGLLDSKLDYYFATADLDFKKPAERGLPYEAIEELLDGIRPRKKLLLMDTCHSGELDREDVQVVQPQGKPQGEVRVRAFRGVDLEVESRVGLGNSYRLLQEMFADLRRGTGAVVISSAGGAEYALESPAWRNGVFTHALLRGLKGEADRNGDGRVQTSELRDFVEQEVRRLTEGRQTPTARRENLAFDFAVDARGPGPSPP